VSRKPLYLGDLEEVELDGSFASKNTDQDCDLALGVVDGRDGSKEVGERSFNDADGFAHGEGGLELGSSLLAKGGDSLNFVFGKRGGLIGGADEASNTLGGADSEPGVIGDNHTNEHITREKLFFDGGFLTFIDFDLFLSWNEDFVDEVLKTHGDYSGF